MGVAIESNLVILPFWWNKISCVQVPMSTWSMITNKAHRHPHLDMIYLLCGSLFHNNTKSGCRRILIQFGSILTSHWTNREVVIYDLFIRPMTSIYCGECIPIRPQRNSLLLWKGWNSLKKDIYLVILIFIVFKFFVILTWAFGCWLWAKRRFTVE